MFIKMIQMSVLIFSISCFISQELGAEESVSIKLTGVPEHLVFPLSKGTNHILTATIKGGTAESAWLAPSRESTGRVILTKVGENEYQINLADSMVSALLLATETEQCYVFIETIDGQVIGSIPIQYSVRSSKPVALDRFRMYVRQGRHREELGYWSNAWYDPGEVDAFEIEFSPIDADLSATAEVDGTQWAFVADVHDPGQLSLDMTDEIRQAWQEFKTLVIFWDHRCSGQIRVIPKTLTLHEIPESLLVIQRRSASLPGSNDYVVVSLGDITAGQVLFTLKTQDRQELLSQHSMKQRDSVDFEYGGTEYRLALLFLFNFLIGDDYAVFLLSPKILTEPQKIEFLLKALSTMNVTLIRNGKEYTGTTAESHLRRELEVEEQRFETMDEFFTAIASYSEETGLEYRVRQWDGTTFEASSWFRDIATTFIADEQ